MRGMILAAGFGTRLKPLTDTIPKALVPVGGKPLLEHALKFLNTVEIDKVIVNAHYKHEQIESFRQASELPFEISLELPEIRGTGGALLCAKEFLMQEETFCVINADIITNVDLKTLKRVFVNLDCDIGLLAVPVGQGGSIAYGPHAYEYAGAFSQDRIVRGAQGADFYGIALYKKHILDLLTPDDFSIVPVWKRAAESGFNVQVIPTPNIYWRDTGTPEQLAQINQDITEGKIRL